MFKKNLLATLVASTLSIALFSIAVISQQLFSNQEAYAALPPIIYNQDPESLQASGLWNFTGQEWYYGNPETNNYDNGKTNNGELITEAQDISFGGNGDYSVKLSFDSKLDTEDSSFYDIASVFINVGDNGWEAVEANLPDSADYTTVSYDISDYVKNTEGPYSFKFAFNTKDAILNQFKGWKVKNIMATITPQFQPQEVVLAPELFMNTQNPHGINQHPQFSISIEHSSMLESMTVMTGDEVIGEAIFQNMAGILCFPETGTCTPGITFATFVWDANQEKPLAPGTYEVYLKVTDKKGQSANSESVIVEITAEEYPVTLQNPLAGEYTVDSTINLAAYMNVNVNVSSMKFYSGDNLIGEHQDMILIDCAAAPTEITDADCFTNTTLSSQTFLLDWTQQSEFPLTVGTHDIYAIATDADGKTYKSDITTIEVIESYPLGDCNGDWQVDASDLSALALEIADGDGEKSQYAVYGDFKGTVACDANQDGLINQADEEPIKNILQGQNEQLCPTVYAPVCGTDGKTYSNTCFLGVNAPEGTEVAYEGKCNQEVKMTEIQLSESELGECTEQDLGTIKFSQDDFYGCKSSGWVKLNQ